MNKHEPRPFKNVPQEQLKVGDVIIPWYSSEAIITGFIDAVPSIDAFAARYVQMAPYTKGGRHGFTGKEMTLEHGSYHRVVIDP
jgi:hypothetical protein